MSLEYTQKQEKCWAGKYCAPAESRRGQARGEETAMLYCTLPSHQLLREREGVRRNRGEDSECLSHPDRWQIHRAVTSTVRNKALINLSLWMRLNTSVSTTSSSSWDEKIQFYCCIRNERHCKDTLIAWRASHVESLGKAATEGNTSLFLFPFKTAFFSVCSAEH